MCLRAAVPARAALPPRAAISPRRRAPLAVVGLVLVLAVGGCTIPGFSASGKTGGSSGSSEDAAAGSGSSWFWYREGDAAATESAPAAWPASSTTTTAAALPTASKAPECFTRLQLITRTLQATGGAGQGTVTWSHLDDPRIIEYRVAAVLQERPGGDDLPAQDWITVARPASGCQEMTTTITGLISGRHYVFWLDAVMTAQPGGTKEPMIGRSNAFLVT
jgi:hypothetical protein